jgi:hypothetical protein
MIVNGRHLLYYDSIYNSTYDLWQAEVFDKKYKIYARFEVLTPMQFPQTACPWKRWQYNVSKRRLLIARRHSITSQ